MNNFRVTTITHNEFKKDTSPRMYSYYPTQVGKLLIFATQQGIYKASFDMQSEDIKHCTFVPTLDIRKLLLIGTPFQCKVWQAALAIDAGTTMHYQELAQKIGYPQSSRAVANALGDNKIPYFVPCHRIIRKDGSLGGYAWGIDKKQQLLQHELGSTFSNI